MKADIDLTVEYPHPIDRVWAALTSAEALAAWLMPNDFQPVTGHRFTFTTKPAPGFDGIVRCEVLEVTPPCRLVWSWAGGKVDTTVTFTLEQAAPQVTRLRMHQVGFHGLGAQLTRRILASGWPGILRDRLTAYLHDPAAPPPGSGTEGWRAYLTIVRRWRHTPSTRKESTMAVTNLEVISVPVSDQDQAKSFYAGKLGFTEQMDGSFGEGLRWVMLQPPGGGTSITLVTWFDTMPAGSLRGSVLGCDNLEETLADLTARGVAFNEEEIEEAPWGRWKTFDDPDGNSWVLQQSHPDFR